MRSLSQGTLLVAVLTVLAIGLLGGLTSLNIIGLSRASARITNDVLAEEQALNHFQQTLDRVVINANNYTRTGQMSELLNARAALAAARVSLARLADITRRNDLDGRSAERQARWERLLADMEGQVAALEGAVRRDESERTREIVRRLNVIVRDSSAVMEETDAQLALLQAEVSREVNRVYRGGLMGTVAIFLLLALGAVGLVLSVRYQIIRPLSGLLAAVSAAGRGQLDQQVAVTSRHEIGQLQAGFNAMVRSLSEQRAAIEERSLALEQANQAQADMLATINALSTPVLPVLERVLVLPIVGHVDDRRAQQMMSRLLAAVYEQHPAFVILDLTGLAALDVDVLNRLIQMVRAAELLGTRVYLVGISPGFAQVIADQDGVGDLTTFRSLREAVQLVVARERAAGG